MSLRPTTATLHACSERSGAWARLFGGQTVAIKSPIPQHAELPGLGVREIYFVDLEKLSPVQLDRIAQEMSVRFDVPLQEVVEGLRTQGLPILAEDVSVSFDARLVL
jgi:hypothetical protein